MDQGLETRDLGLPSIVRRLSSVVHHPPSVGPRMAQLWDRLTPLARPNAPYLGVLVGALIVTLIGMQISSNLALSRPEAELLAGDWVLWTAERTADYSTDSLERRQLLTRDLLDPAIVQDAEKDRAARRAQGSTAGRGFGTRDEVDALLRATDRIARGEVPAGTLAQGAGRFGAAASAWAATGSNANPSVVLPGPSRANELPPVVADAPVLALDAVQTPTPAPGVQGSEGGPGLPAPAPAPSPVCPRCRAWWARLSHR